MSMQDGYLTLLTYDNSLARRRKHRARLRQRRMLVNFAFFMAVTSVGRTVGDHRRRGNGRCGPVLEASAAPHFEGFMPQSGHGSLATVNGLS